MTAYASFADQYDTVQNYETNTWRAQNMAARGHARGFSMTVPAFEAPKIGADFGTKSPDAPAQKSKSTSIAGEFLLEMVAGGMISAAFPMLAPLFNAIPGTGGLISPATGAIDAYEGWRKWAKRRPITAPAPAAPAPGTQAAYKMKHSFPGASPR